MERSKWCDFVANFKKKIFAQARNHSAEGLSDVNRVWYGRCEEAHCTSVEVRPVWEVVVVSEGLSVPDISHHRVRSLSMLQQRQQWP